MRNLTFTRRSRGLYTAGNWRFVLEFQKSLRAWRLRDSGDLVGYMRRPRAHCGCGARSANPLLPFATLPAWAKHALRERAALAARESP